jgi:HK97 gp10 family phage protein
MDGRSIDLNRAAQRMMGGFNCDVENCGPGSQPERGYRERCAADEAGLAMEITLTLKGGAELGELLKAMPDRMASNVMRGAMLAGANVIRDRARELAPIASGHTPPGHESGHLRKCIVSGRGRGGRDTVTTLVGVTQDGFYGRYVEFGTASNANTTFGHVRVKGKKKGIAIRAHHATKAEPFMRTAADEEAGAAAQAIIDYASKRVVEAAVGAGVVDPLYDLEDADAA